MSGDRPDTRTAGAASDLARQALFPGLVYNQQGEEARVVMIGGVAHYAIPDNGFLRHVEASTIDEAVISVMQETLGGVREEIVQGMLQMMGTDDILAKAALEASLKNVGPILRRTDPAQWAPLLRLYGFRIVVDVHGTVQQVIFPGQEAPGSEE